MANFLQKLLSAGEGRQLKGYEAIVETINSLEEKMSGLTDEELRTQTDAFKVRVQAGETLQDLLPEAFAAVREGSRRALEMRHFDVQLIGAMVLNDGKIAEMKTGEGKTLVATAAVYLNALAQKGVHVVTVNDYLAKRDSEWMGRLYKFMGLSVGILQSQMDDEYRKAAYAADVTYGTNSEFGFDYLRDNMVNTAQARVQRGHVYAVVDEVDSILIDEARTPLIISGAGDKSAAIYKDFAKAIPRLTPEVDFELDEAHNTCAPTEPGISKVERLLGIDDLYADNSGQLANHLQQALRAQFLFSRDVDYLVADGEVLIVDEFTGRPMYGRRYSEGLHQAIEAKERVSIREENQTLATITLQNYFRMYEKLSGMTGTAITEDKEFREIYSLPVMVIPTDRPMIREDRNDLVYRSVEVKFNAVADFVAERHSAGQPCLLGTISIEHSEALSKLLKKRGIPHNVLNAKHHEKEAHIIAQAGRFGAVTIATNMAGRGTDILLGGNPGLLVEDFLRAKGIDPESASEEEYASAVEVAQKTCKEEHRAVIEAGGLAVLGTERHDSRRIDNQLRGRSGRQGDPGFSQFYLSLEDDLMRLFGGDRMDRVAQLLANNSETENMPIQAGLISKAVESAQLKVESMNFASRKYVLEYDDVMNSQRETIYGERTNILDGKDMHVRVEALMSEAMENNVISYAPVQGYKENWDLSGLETWFRDFTGITDTIAPLVESCDTSPELVLELSESAVMHYDSRVEKLGEEDIRDLERQVMLRVLDTRWMAHLQEMDYLKEGIGLRAMGQRDPIVEYKNEAYDMFSALVASINEDFLRTLMHVEFVAEQSPEPSYLRNASYSAPSEGSGFSAIAENATAQDGPSSQDSAKEDPYANVGRNDMCPCGSGKKFKKCHGA